MREFETFIRSLFSILLVLYGVVLLLSGLLTNWNTYFLLSFSIGYGVMILDYILLVKFSRRVPILVKANYFPKSGFFWRYLFVASILIGTATLFTQLDFFAIILAVAATNVGLILSVIKHYKEWRGWNTEA
ncbi:MAG: hypothetical protein ABGX27_05675 [Desulfurobacteriaceae bacterium]